MPRFFTDRVNGGTIVMTGEDARHMIRSLRMKPGESVTVCDFFNTEYECTVEKLTDTEVTLKIVSSHPSECEPTVAVTVYQALTKGDKFDTIVQKAVELGAVRIVPVLTERCVSRPDEKSMQKKCERWRKIALEAAKQCGRARIPLVSDVRTVNEVVGEMAESTLSFVCYEKESEVSLRAYLDSNSEKLDSAGNAASISFLIGSEGGLSDEEAELFRKNGIATVSLGKRILRTETAPIAVLSAVMFRTRNLE